MPEYPSLYLLEEASVALGLVLNPTSDGFPAELNIGTGAYQPKAAEFLPPTPKPAYASSYDTEGSVATDEAHYENREITIGMWVRESDPDALERALNALERMVGQFNREGGVLKLTSPNGTACYFDLVPEASATVTVDHLYLWRDAADVTVRLMARPFWRGEEILAGTFFETLLPVLTGTVYDIPGSVPALGRFVVTDTQSGGQTRWTVIVGGESRWFSSADTALPFYEAETLTPTSTSTKTAGATGASGSGNNVIRNTDLTTTYQAILKSEIDTTNLALTHKGTYRIWARLYRPAGNTGAVSVRLEWAEGDYLRTTLNDPVAYGVDDREGVFTWANLGIVSIDPSSTRWEFRLLAKSTVAGDEIDADCFFICPTEVTYIELSGNGRFQTPTSFSALSTMDTEAGAITGDSATIGGVWVGAGSANDFTVGSGIATRTAVSDADAVTGRYAVSGVAGFAAQAVQVDFRTSAATLFLEQAVLARYTDVNNWMRAELFWTTGGNAQVRVWKRVGGSTLITATSRLLTASVNTWYTLRLQVDAGGRYFVWWFPQGIPSASPIVTGQDSVLATGGTLASGKPGFYDASTSATATTRDYDNFLAFPVVPDAAIHGQQSLTLGPTYATREDSTGTFSTTISNRNGRYLKIPPAGPEGRSTRLAVLALPNDPYTAGDAAAIYDLSGQLYVTPRGLVVPEA